MIHGNFHGEYDDQADLFRFSADVGLFIADSSKFICPRANRQTNSGSPQNWVVQHGHGATHAQHHLLISVSLSHKTGILRRGTSG